MKAPFEGPLGCFAYFRKLTERSATRAFLFLVPL